MKVTVALHGQRGVGEIVLDAVSAADAIEGFTRQTGVLDLVPFVGGGCGDFGRILIGAALIAVSFIPGIGQAVHVALIIAGATMALQGVLGFFVKAPSANSDTDPAASKYYTARGNTTASGTPIARRYGRVPVFGQILTENVDAQDLILGSFPASPA